MKNEPSATRAVYPMPNQSTHVKIVSELRPDEAAHRCDEGGLAKRVAGRLALNGGSPRAIVHVEADALGFQNRPALGPVGGGTESPVFRAAERAGDEEIEGWAAKVVYGHGADDRAHRCGATMAISG